MKKSQLKQLIKEEIQKLLEDQIVIDKILDKISTSGIESLTPQEKAYLEKYSKGEKNIPSPSTLYKSTGVKADLYPTEASRDRKQVYDGIAGDLLKPLVDLVSQELDILDITPDDIRISLEGLWNDNPSLSIQIKAPNNYWEKPWTGNNLIIQTRDKTGVIINNKRGVKFEYDEVVDLPEVQEVLDNIYNLAKKKKILSLVNIKLSQFMAGFTNKDLIAPNTPIIYTGK